MWLSDDLCFLRIKLNPCLYKVLELCVMNTKIMGTGLKALISLTFQVAFQTWLEMRTGLSHKFLGPFSFSRMYHE